MVQPSGPRGADLCQPLGTEASLFQAFGKFSQEHHFLCCTRQAWPDPLGTPWPVVGGRHANRQWPEVAAGLSGLCLEKRRGRFLEDFLEEVTLSLRLVAKSLLGCGGVGEAPGGSNSIVKGTDAEELSRRGHLTDEGGGGWAETDLFERSL